MGNSARSIRPVVFEQSVVITDERVLAYIIDRFQSTNLAISSKQGKTRELKNTFALKCTTNVQLSGKYLEAEFLQQTNQNAGYLQIVSFHKTNSATFLFSCFFFRTGPIGLDWKKLNATLNPNFDWEAAVKAALKTDDSLEDVRLHEFYCYIFFNYKVSFIRRKICCVLSPSCQLSIRKGISLPLSYISACICTHN